MAKNLVKVYRNNIAEKNFNQGQLKGNFVPFDSAFIPLERYLTEIFPQVHNKAHHNTVSNS
jgi:hypothetical protein